MKPYYRTDNSALYQCDNLDLMNFLPDNYIDLIYCDILYNTRKNFKTYNDNLGSTQDALLWYIPRLQQIYRILKPTGLLYLQMDYRLVHYLKVELDKIFGEQFFCRHIIWCYTSGGISKTDFPSKHDDILKYSKGKSYTYVPELKPYSEKTLQRGLTQCKGENYELSKEGTPIVDWWNDITPLLSPTCYERLGYDTQKPKKLLERIIKTSSNKNDIIADFFMGSGTTGEVALDLNRKFIGCDIGQKACEISQKRLENWQKTQ